MIRVEKLLYRLDQKLNKVASETHQAIPIEDKILALQEAQMRLIKKKVNKNNLYKEGFDAFKVRYEDLQNLVVPYEELIPSPSQEPVKAFETEIPENYYLPVDIILFCTKGGCTNHKVYVKRVAKHGDVITWVNNPHLTPSFSYQETFAAISNNKIICYTNDDFTIDKIRLSYLRYPAKIDFEGYITLDNQPSQTVNCELPEYLEDELLELAVMELGYDTENNNAAQAAIQKSLNSE